MENLVTALASLNAKEINRFYGTENDVMRNDTLQNDFYDLSALLQRFNYINRIEAVNFLTDAPTEHKEIATELLKILACAKESCTRWGFTFERFAEAMSKEPIENIL